MAEARKFTLVVEGQTEAAYADALDEATLRIREGNLAGADRNEDGRFYFDSTSEVDEAPKPNTIPVNANALRLVLSALEGPGHLIRELQAARSIEALLGGTNPISELVRNYNEAIK